jgi:hypothetical protein
VASSITGYEKEKPLYGERWIRSSRVFNKPPSPKLSVKNLEVMLCLLTRALPSL